MGFSFFLSSEDGAKVWPEKTLLPRRKYFFFSSNTDLFFPCVVTDRRIGRSLRLWSNIKFFFCETMNFGVGARARKKRHHGKRSEIMRVNAPCSNLYFVRFCFLRQAEQSEKKPRPAPGSYLGVCYDELHKSHSYSLFCVFVAQEFGTRNSAITVAHRVRIQTHA